MLMQTVHTTVFDVISALGAYTIIFMAFSVLNSLIVSKIGKFEPLF